MPCSLAISLAESARDLTLKTRIVGVTLVLSVKTPELVANFSIQLFHQVGVSV